MVNEREAWGHCHAEPTPCLGLGCGDAASQPGFGCDPHPARYLRLIILHLPKTQCRLRETFGRLLYCLRAGPRGDLATPPSCRFELRARRQPIHLMHSTPGERGH